MVPPDQEQRLTELNEGLNALLSFVADAGFTSDQDDKTVGELMRLESKAREASEKLNNLIIQRLAHRANSAEAALSHIDRKIQHGCTDAYCPECDKG